VWWGERLRQGLRGELEYCSSAKSGKGEGIVWARGRSRTLEPLGDTREKEEKKRVDGDQPQ